MGEAKRRKTSGENVPRKRTDKSDKGGKWMMIGGIVALLLVVMVVWWVTQPPEPTSDALPDVSADAEPFPATFDSVGVSIGDADAPVVVREFADYQCPACARFAPASKRLRDEYVKSGQVRLVFYDLPLTQHEYAQEAALAARCAADQDAFWPMHDRLFEHQGEWSSSSDPVGTFARYADELGLDSRRLERCVETELHRQDISQSVGVAQQLRVASTPTVYVDNIRLTRPGWAQMQAVIERELAAQP
ncbi:DsbA family protein [Marinobacter fonticola]|uniref:DsbA family protein n=1 Tax=Marinobacter fonticola TaxID=2603215 RepID=UPI0011E6C7B8|nr:thioredoxin domain-containing protein [Marinobacter fonticola]